MRGMSRNTGKPLDGAAHLVASIKDILTTPLRSRCMLRDYGSRLPELVDRPMNPLLSLELQAATAEALQRWEPRFALRSVFISADNGNGRIIIGVEGVVKENGATIRIEGIKL